MLNVVDLFELFVPENLFIHEDQIEFSYDATLKNNGNLPGWLEFDTNSLKLFGSP